MWSWRFAAAIASGLLAAVGTSGVSQAASYYELRYSGGMSSAAMVTDASSNANHGTVTVANGGLVTSLTDRGGSNAFLRFPGGTCPTAPCPQAMITPTTSANLVPNASGTGTFTFGAHIRLTETPSATAGMNVFQRGFAAAGVSQWKLQADSGVPSCRWSDGVNSLLLPDSGDPKYTLPVGRWVKVKCSRLAGDVFEIRITDPVTGALLTPVLRKTVAIGAITPTGNAVIGAKKIDAGQVDSQTDQFHGDLDEIFFHRD